MLRHRLFRLSIAAALSLAVCPAARALRPVSAEEAPKADAKLLRALSQGAEEVRVIIGVQDGTPSARTLLERPDPAGEPARRLRRLDGQKRLVGAIPQDEFRVRHYFESFSLLAGRATRDGIVRLANRPDVAWVTLDETRRRFQASPQASQTLIRSDAANAAGVTGAGQAVAVLDTGVDYSISALGGGGFPNAKVVGGMDTADEDNDPMDCEGHGTSVSGIVAGPNGVAPDAKIVAIKVFSSTDATNSTCKDTAFVSDILQGINFAISHKADFHIAAINMSLGAEPDDDTTAGYCDTSEPAEAAAIDSAVAADIAVVVAAGNGTFTHSLAAPACISSAISVGAVYSISSTLVRWSDPSGCTDQPVVPDLVTCFSDSNTNLSLLAPGAFWTTVDKGGRTVVNFGGTSASTPAAAGAIALVRQARPALTAFGALGVLRSTGSRVSDPRNNIITPRVDTLAAIQLAPNRFAGFSGSAVPIPDGTGSASATATISGLSGSVASVLAWAQIDHPDPRELRLRLTGPDGTSVLLHDRTGALQQPINAVYGWTDVPAQPLSVFQGKPANGTWTLTVEDSVAGSTGRIRNFSVTIVPGQPVVPIPAQTDGSVLPVVGRVQGTKFFLSDVRLYNPTAASKSFSLYYVPVGQSGATALRATRAVGAGQVLALNDVIFSEFGFDSSLGEMTIVAADPAFIATSRAYTRSANGTFGQFVPGFRSTTGLSFGQGRATANGFRKDSSFHTNVGFTEVSGAPVTARIDLLDANGVLLASTTRDAADNQTLLVTDIIGDRGLGATANFRVDFTVTSLTGRIVPFAILIDDATGDGLFEPAGSPAASSSDVIVTQASFAQGNNDTFFKTNLHMTNVGASPVTLTVSLIPRIITGTPSAPRVYSLAPGQTIEKANVLNTEFGLQDPSAAGLRIHPGGPAQLVVSTRTFVEKFGGTFGFFIPGLSTSSSGVIGLGTGRVAAIQLDQSSAATGSRSNFGIAEIGGADVLVRVTAKSGETGAALGSKSYFVSANTSFQTSVTDILGSGAFATNVYLQFELEGGAGRILAYGVAVDNTSGDAIYVPAQREP
ncbi:MAG TPA: S8 family serine peptidase [Thermoanaerobaculia bacterium]